MASVNWHAAVVIHNPGLAMENKKYVEYRAYTREPKEDRLIWYSHQLHFP